MNIIIITGNNLNEESGLIDFPYYENIKKENYIIDMETYINNSLKYKFPNYSHQSIINFINKNKTKHNISIFDQSYFNFFEKVDKNLKIIKLEKDISKFRCIICNRKNKENECEKCKTQMIHNFPILNDTFPHYEKLLKKIGLKKLMNLNFKFEENGSNQPIWTLDTKFKEKTLIISIGVQDTVIPLEVYFKDVITLDRQNIFNIYYLDNKISNLNIDYEIKTEIQSLNSEIDNFLLKIEKENNL